MTREKKKAQPEGCKNRKRESERKEKDKRGIRKRSRGENCQKPQK